MKFMFKRLLVTLIIFFLSVTSARAQGEFLTNYNVSYQVDNQGQTHVAMDVELTNLLSNIYASEFTVSIGSTNLENINLKLDGGEAEPNVAVGNKTTNITIVFPDKVLGKDKSQRFTLEFSSRDFARRLGRVWEVTIPRLAKIDSGEDYHLTLSIPQSFGPPSLITPKPASESSSGQNRVYRFKTEDLYENGVAATFGQEQSFNFELNYYLNNPYFYPIVTEIALPPDTAWQQVLYQSITPQPVKIEVDADGNWLASYRLGSQENLAVVASGSASIFLKPRTDYPLGLNTGINYLSSQQYWEVDQPQVKEIAKKLTTPRQIYQYVVENLIYDYGRLEQSPARWGAANVLDNQDSALCSEFTDLFIALARASGIKARAINGFAYTDNSSLRPLSLKQDVLHAWPEYYDETRQLWVPVDPTWGNTTGGVDFFSQPDLNHFTFAIQGRDSTYPIPAGAYKNGQDPSKTVFVDFGPKLTPSSGLKLEFNLPKEVIAGIDTNAELTVTNTGNVALYQVPVSISSQHFKIKNNQQEIAILPPQGKTTINFTLPATSWTSNVTDKLTAESGESVTTFNLNITPAYRLIIGKVSVLLAVLIMLAITVGLGIKTVLKWRK
jgi:transglutaminase-like putative cysteine protease